MTCVPAELRSHPSGPPLQVAVLSGAQGDGDVVLKHRPGMSSQETHRPASGRRPGLLFARSTPLLLPGVVGFHSKWSMKEVGAKGWTGFVLSLVSQSGSRRGVQRDPEDLKAVLSSYVNCWRG